MSVDIIQDTKGRFWLSRAIGVDAHTLDGAVVPWDKSTICFMTMFGTQNTHLKSSFLIEINGNAAKPLR